MLNAWPCGDLSVSHFVRSLRCLAVASNFGEVHRSRLGSDTPERPQLAHVWLLGVDVRQNRRSSPGSCSSRALVEPDLDLRSAAN